MRSIQVTSSSAPGELARSAHLLVRVVTDDAGAPLVFLDTSGDRTDGGWTYQSTISANAWDLLIDERGRPHRHASLPDRWEWSRIDEPVGFRWVRDGDATVICIPTELLDGAARVQVAAEIDDSWLPAPFVAGVSYPAATPRTSGGEPLRAPGRLAFAYQFAPWMVRDCDPSGTDLTCATEVYGGFDHVVFAAGLELPGHSSHGGTERLIESIRSEHPDTEIWGYVSMLRHGQEWYGVDVVAERAKRWAEIGVTGIFLDEFGLCEEGWRACQVRPDGTQATLTRTNQRDAVQAIHGMGLPVFANAHSMHGAFGVHRGESSPLGGGDGERAADMYLLENPTVWAGDWWTGLDLRAAVARFHDMPDYATRSRVRVAVVDTGPGWVDDDAVESPEYAASWWRAAMIGADAHAYTNDPYSAPDHLATNLPVLGPPPDAPDLGGLGLRFAGPVRLASDGWTSTRGLTDAAGRPAGLIRITVDPETGAVHGSLER